VKTIVPKLLAACIAFSAAANMAHTAEKPKPWAKKFTMSREECSRRMIERRQMVGGGGAGHGGRVGGFSNLTNVHDYDYFGPSWISKCTERYGHL